MSIIEGAGISAMLVSARCWLIANCAVFCSIVAPHIGMGNIPMLTNHSGWVWWLYLAVLGSLLSRVHEKAPSW
jgi:hypothetical protein